MCSKDCLLFPAVEVRIYTLSLFASKEVNGSGPAPCPECLPGLVTTMALGTLLKWLRCQ